MEYIKENQILLYEELCAKLVDENDPRVKATRLFRKNIRLANLVAARFKGSYDGVLDQEDMYQCAYEGLWKACLNFDESRGFEFSTYAVPMIKGQILRELRDCEALKTPRYFKDIRAALLSHGFTLPLSDEEIDVLVSEGRFSRAQIMAYAEPDICSIDSPVKEDSETTLGEILTDSSILPMDTTLSEEEIEQAIDKVLQYIKPKYRDLVEEWMYATLEGDKITQWDLARKYKCGQPMVGRILRATIDIVKMHGDEIRKIFGI